MLNTKLLTLSAIVALSFGISACSDDSGAPSLPDLPEVPDTPECTVDVCAADGYTLNKCMDGKIVPQDCAKSGKICSNDACIDPVIQPEESECTKDICIDGIILNKCYEGTYVKQDCSKSGKICSNDECVDKQDDPIDPECTVDACDDDGVTLLKCNDGTIEIIDCLADHDKICSDNACVDKIDGPVDPECTVDACDKDGITLLKCNNGTIEKVNCSADQDKICSDNACVDPEPEKCTTNICTEKNVLKLCNPETGEYQEDDCAAQNLVCDTKLLECVKPKCTAEQNACDGTTAYICNDDTGEVDTVDCAKSGKICKLTISSDNIKTAACEWECDDTYENSCVNSTTVKLCNEHHIATTTCEEGKSCKAGECIVKTEEDICVENGMVWNDELKKCVSQSSVVGGACKCLKNCEITISGAELKNIFSSEAQALASTLLDEIKDGDTIVAPNFFPGKDNIEGCDELAAVVPEGMTLGCLYNKSITFPKSLTDLIHDLPNKSLTILFYTVNFSDFIKDDLKTKIEGIADLLAAGIQFTSPQGYCLAATIDISGDLQANVKALGGLLNLPLVNGNPLDKNNGLVKKINTGDHATVLSKSASADNYCPAGSTLFSYTMNFEKPINEETEMSGMKANIEAIIKADIGFDMCLKACNDDDDCRKEEGYSCVEIPDGVPAEGQTADDVPKKKACFDPQNIEYFTNMTNQFAPAE